MYLAIRLLEHMDEKLTQEAIGKLLKLSVRSVRTTIKELLQTRHCYHVKGNPKVKIAGSYHSNKLYPDGTGYLEQNSISEIASRLEEKGFLQIEKRQHETQLHFEKCYYTLLR